MKLIYAKGWWFGVRSHVSDESLPESAHITGVLPALTTLCAHVQESADAEHLHSLPFIRFFLSILFFLLYCAFKYYDS